MGKLLIFDPRIAGVSGDMILGALLDIGGSERVLAKLAEAIEREVDHVDELKIEVRDVWKCGIKAKKLEVNLKQHLDHHHHESAVDLREDMLRVAECIKIGEETLNKALKALDLLIDAECSVHGVEREKAHFHELASADTIFDILGTMMLLEDLGFAETGSKIVSLPVAVGVGEIRMEHLSLIHI